MKERCKAKVMDLPKPYLDVDDIMQIMNCGQSKAYNYMKAIRDYSDVGRTEGRVMMHDYLVWAYGSTDIANINTDKYELMQKTLVEDIVATLQEKFGHEKKPLEPWQE